jgi:hypothetical protein
MSACIALVCADTHVIVCSPGFWEALMHNTVPFRTLAACIKNMDVTIRTADRVYK